MKILRALYKCFGWAAFIAKCWTDCWVFLLEVLCSDNILWGHIKQLFTKQATSKDNLVHAPSQWETTLQCDVISHWLGVWREWSLYELAALHSRRPHDMEKLLAFCERYHGSSLIPLYKGQIKQTLIFSVLWTGYWVIIWIAGDLIHHDARVASLWYMITVVVHRPSHIIFHNIVCLKWNILI